jgi:hypothetical protein
MTKTHYVPASRTKARNLRLIRMSVRTSDDRELGKLMGFVLDRPGHISGLVMEVPASTGAQQVEVPLVPLQIDANSNALRLIDTDHPRMTRFQAESTPQIDEYELWVPLFEDSAA